MSHHRCVRPPQTDVEGRARVHRARAGAHLLLLFVSLAPSPAGADEPTSPLAAAAARAQAARAGAATGTYTETDLERVRPLRDETGVGSQPAFEASSERPARAARGRRAGARDRSRSSPAGERAAEASSPLHDARAEHYWRGEARRVQTRTRSLRARAQAWQRRIDQRRRQPGVRPYSDPQIVEWQRQRDEVEAQARELEGDLDDRARRARALPGWLR